jgi:NitT/TauT family transport system ATP-binding protein
MVKPATGSVRMASSDRHLATAMIWQEDALIPWRSILDNVSLALELRGVGRKERIRLAREQLATMGLTQFADAYPYQISGGMRQRAGIARALVADAAVLLMDEPFAAVDAQTRLLLQEEVLDLWQRDRKTVLFVTHSIEEALLLGDRVVVMSARPGRIIDVIEVSFPRPRRREIEESAEFRHDVRRVWDLLRNEVRRAEQLAS